MGIDSGLWQEPVDPSVFDVFGSGAYPPPEAPVRPAPGDAELAEAITRIVGAILARPHTTPRGSGGYLRALSRLLTDLPAPPMEQLVAILHLSRLWDRQILVLGEGASLSTATYFARDLCRTRPHASLPALRARSLTDDVENFPPQAEPGDIAQILEDRVTQQVQPQDVVIAITTEMEASTLLPAVVAARAKGAVVIALTGSEGGRLAAQVDEVIAVPAARLEQVRGAHLFIQYVVCTALRELESAVAGRPQAMRQ